MNEVDATFLKNRLGQVLAEAALAPIAIRRHGRVVAYLVPAKPGTAPPRASRHEAGEWNRAAEERALNLCASGDFRPSRWLRAGDRCILGGIAAMLASEEGYDRQRLLALAERLHPKIASPSEFNRWLAETPVLASRFLPALKTRLRSSRGL